MTLGPEHSIRINRCRILHRFNLRQNAPVGDLFMFLFSQQFKLPKHRFKLRQNAHLSDLVLKGFPAVPTSENIESRALDCNI